MADVFISFSHEDVRTAEQLATFLTAKGHTVWWDRKLQVGRDFDREIEVRIGEAKAVVVVWSTTSVDSRWVRTEAGEALDQGKLLPIQIDTCRVPMEFRRIQTAQLVEWDGSGDHPELNKLLVGLTSALNSKGRRGDIARTGEWSVASKEFQWAGANVTLQHGSVRRTIAYKNHLDFEAVYLDGTEVCRGGDRKRRQNEFRFYLDDAGTPYQLSVEPVYGAIGLMFGRIGGLKVAIDGSKPIEVTR